MSLKPLLMRYFGVPLLASLAMLTLSLSGQLYAAERLDLVLAKGELKVCIWPGYYAISYRNPRTKNLEGIDIDMAAELAAKLGVKLQFVESSFAHLVENIENNTCDIAMHGVGVRDSRKPHMDFSTPYLASDIYAVSTRDNSHIRRWQDIDQPGNIVVVLRGTYMEPVIKKRFQKATVTVVDSFKAREQEVLSGRADLFMTDFPYGKKMAELTEWATLIAPDQPIAKTYYAYAVPKGEQGWLDVINGFVAEMKANGTLQKLAHKHGLQQIVVLE